jgi:hypothetical protein
MCTRRHSDGHNYGINFIYLLIPLWLNSFVGADCGVSLHELDPVDLGSGDAEVIKGLAGDGGEFLVVLQVVIWGGMLSETRS